MSTFSSAQATKSSFSRKSWCQQHGPLYPADPPLSLQTAQHDALAIPDEVRELLPGSHLSVTAGIAGDSTLSLNDYGLVFVEKSVMLGRGSYNSSKSKTSSLTSVSCRDLLQNRRQKCATCIANDNNKHCGNFVYRASSLSALTRTTVS